MNKLELTSMILFFGSLVSLIFIPIGYRWYVFAPIGLIIPLGLGIINNYLERKK